MGVRGLTTYIARYSEKYLSRYELHDTYLIIDGYSLASQLYIHHSNCTDLFGGDYDKYARCIEHFFGLLKECSVTPVVIFDGGYERRKFRTVYSRMRSKFFMIRRLKTATQMSTTMFPLFLREVFKDVLVKLNVACVRCDFEADYEIACAARFLQCPVLSYDSDFYIFDVLYIPFTTLDVSVKKRKYSFIECEIYNIEAFLKQFRLDKSVLPLMATLLGNDYIKRGVFYKFYDHINVAKQRNLSHQQRTVGSLLKWLSGQTFDTAVAKVLGRLKRKERRRIGWMIKRTSEAYVCKRSELLDCIDLKTNNDKEISNNFDIDKIVNGIDGDEDDDDDEGEDIVESNTDSEEDEGDIAAKELGEEIDDNETVLPTRPIPEWFKQNFRKCLYPSCFMDLISQNTYFAIPQVEDITNESSHSISFPIIQIIYGLLTPGGDQNLVVISRNTSASLKKHILTRVTTPNVTVENLDKNDAKNLLLKLLGCENSLETYQTEWQLYILAITYWIRNGVRPVVNICHLYSLILSFIYITYIDVQIGYYRSPKKFLKKYGNKLNGIKSKTSPSSDCIVTAQALIKYFQTDEKLKTNPKYFDVEIVDAYAQFQSCFLHISHLNALLNFPLPASSISAFYNGTFVYNMYTNLKKRNDVDQYIDTLLNGSGTVIGLFKNTVEQLKGFLQQVATVSRRKRKRKKGPKQSIIVDAENSEDSEELYDANNKFSLLAVAGQ